MNHLLKPSVPGSIARGSVVDWSVHPPIVSRLRMTIDGWDGDQILARFPCFMITDSLAETFRKEGLTGYELADMEVQISDIFQQLYGEIELPVFHWLKITGKEDRDDFSLTAEHRLAASQRAFDLILATDPVDLLHEPIQSS